MFSLKTGLNLMRPINVFQSGVYTLQEVDRALDALETQGTGPVGYEFPPRLPWYTQDVETSGVSYFTFEPVIQPLMDMVTLGISRPEEKIPWIDTAPGFKNYCAYIPSQKDATTMCSGLVLGTMYAAVWSFDWISISHDNEALYSLPLITSQYPSRESLQMAEMRPTRVSRLKTFLTDKKICFIGWDRAKEEPPFLATFGIPFAETPEEAGITPTNPMGHSDKMIYLDMQKVAAQSWGSFVTKCHAMTEADIDPSLEAIVLVVLAV